MAMTSAVKDELARVELNKTCCRKAEVSALLRFAGGLHLVAGQIVVEAELDAAYNRYLTNTKDGMAKSGTKMAKRTKKLQKQKVKFVAHYY